MQKSDYDFAKFTCLKYFPLYIYIVYSTKPLNHLYIVDPLLITLTVLLGSINQIGICDDHNVYSGASCFKEH